MTQTETARNQYEALRDAYDLKIEALASEFAVLQTNGYHASTNPSEGFWPHLNIPSRNEYTPHLVTDKQAETAYLVTFRGFHHDFYLAVPHNRFAEFLVRAMAHLNEYDPEEIYRDQENA